MKTVFFEVQEWERKLLRKHYPEAILTEEYLTPENVGAYADAEAISTFIYSSVSKEVISHFHNLKCIATRSTGFDHINVAFCKEKNIPVFNVPEYGSHTVAEHTFALILTLTRKIHQSINQAKQLNFEHAEIQGVDLYGKTLGVVGLGKIGIEVVKIAKGFGMNVLVYTRTQKPELATEYGFTYSSLEDLLPVADVVTLHLPFMPETKHIINKKNILTFKKHSFLINTARGGLVETDAIVLGLQNEILEGVGLDVLEEEKELNEEIDILTPAFRKTSELKTLVLNHMLINHPKVVITPHNAFNSREALRRIVEVTIENLDAFEKGERINEVKTRN